MMIVHRFRYLFCIELHQLILLLKKNVQCDEQTVILHHFLLRKKKNSLLIYIYILPLTKQIFQNDLYC